MNEEQKTIGRWGRMRRDYLREHLPATYSTMVMHGELWPHLYALDQQAEDYMEQLIAQMKSAEGVTEELKRKNSMAWVGHMNNIRARAEEIIQKELIYGMARCPFHDDHTPSMKIDDRFHCFACGADGDVIDYAGRLFGLSPGDAARKLAADFGLRIEVQVNTPVKNAEPPITEQFCISVLWMYLRLLRIWRIRYEPSSPDEPMDDRFVESLQMTDWVWDLLDELCYKTPADAQQTIKILKEGRLIERMNDYVTRREREKNGRNET